jgi:hypothetical protein
LGVSSGISRYSVSARSTSAGVVVVAAVARAGGGPFDEVRRPPHRELHRLLGHAQAHLPVVDLEDFAAVIELGERDVQVELEAAGPK